MAEELVGLKNYFHSFFSKFPVSTLKLHKLYFFRPCDDELNFHIFCSLFVSRNDEIQPSEDFGQRKNCTFSMLGFVSLEFLGIFLGSEFCTFSQPFPNINPELRT